MRKLMQFIKTWNFEWAHWKISSNRCSLAQWQRRTPLRVLYNKQGIWWTLTRVHLKYRAKALQQWEVQRFRSLTKYKGFLCFCSSSFTTAMMRQGRVTRKEIAKATRMIWRVATSRFRTVALDPGQRLHLDTSKRIKPNWTPRPMWLSKTLSETKLHHNRYQVRNQEMLN